MRTSNLWLLTVLGIALSASAQVPTTVHHQGSVAVNGDRFTGQGAFRFALVNPQSNVYLWVNDGSAVVHPAQPTNPVSLQVLNGVYQVRLGDNELTNMTAIPSAVFNENNDVALRVWFDDQQGNGTHRLSPDLPMTTAPFAQRANVSTQLNIPGTNTAAATVNGSGKVTVPAGLTVNGTVGGTGFNGWDINQSNDLITSTNFGGDVSGTFDALQVSEGIGINNGRLFALSGAGAVGIGTTAPQRTLHLGDAAIPNSEGMIRLSSRSGVSGFIREWDVGVPETDGATGGIGYSFVIDDLQLGTTPEFMIKLNSGNVGIGTGSAAPAARLQVAGGAIMPAIGGTAMSGIYFPPNPGGGSGDDAFVRYYLSSGEDTNFDIGTSNDGQDRIRFIQWGAARMALYNGNVGIGTETPTVPLDLETGPVGTGWQIRLFNTAAPGFHVGLRAGDSGFFDIDSQIEGGSGFARLNNTGNWTVVSDARVKTDVHPLTGVLEKALALAPVSFRFTEAVRRDGDAAPTDIGFIAQSVQQLFPSLVVNGPDVLTLNYSGLSVVAIAALQEQQVEIQQQQSEVTRLHAENQDLRARLERVERTMSRLLAGEKAVP